MVMRCQLKPMLLGLVILAGSVPVALAAAPDAPVAAPNPETARVWFLRPGSPASTAFGAAPAIYANGTPVAAISAASAFSRDFPPGSYRFSVAPYGLPTGQAATVQLRPGSETYLEVQWAPTWEEGYPGGGGTESHSFFVRKLSPRVAQAYLPTLTLPGRP